MCRRHPHPRSRALLNTLYSTPCMQTYGQRLRLSNCGAAGMVSKQVIEIGSRRPKGTGRQYAYELLRRGILKLEFPPGAMLDEALLVEQSGVSRTLIREAIVG